MFERFRQRSASTGGPPDLFALPPVPVGHPLGLAAVPADLLGAYLRHPVAEIRPMDPLGPEATGFIGDAVHRRMREHGVGGPDQGAARIARMRAEGLSEEQIEQVQAQAAAPHGAPGWTVRFANDTYASVEPQAPGTAFSAMRERFARQYARRETLFDFALQRLRESPYETYYDGGTLTAGGRAHEVTVQSAGVHSNHFPQVLGGLAAVTLRVLGS